MNSTTRTVRLSRWFTLATSGAATWGSAMGWLAARIVVHLFEGTGDGPRISYFPLFVFSVLAQTVAMVLTRNIVRTDLSRNVPLLSALIGMGLGAAFGFNAGFCGGVAMSVAGDADWTAGVVTAFLLAAPSSLFGLLTGFVLGVRAARHGGHDGVTGVRSER